MTESENVRLLIKKNNNNTFSRITDILQFFFPDHFPGFLDLVGNLTVILVKRHRMRLYKNYVCCFAVQNGGFIFLLDDLLCLLLCPVMTLHFHCPETWSHDYNVSMTLW